MSCLIFSSASLHEYIFFFLTSPDLCRILVAFNFSLLKDMSGFDAYCLRKAMKVCMYVGVGACVCVCMCVCVGVCVCVSI
jgi:hypothetical protein